MGGRSAVDRVMIAGSALQIETELRNFSDKIHGSQKLDIVIDRRGHGTSIVSIDHDAAFHAFNLPDWQVHKFHLKIDVLCHGSHRPVLGDDGTA